MTRTPFRIGTLAATTGILVVAGLLLFSSVAAQPSSDNHTICHATVSESNPFVVITIDPEAVYNGHLGSSQDHQSSEDIIPPFTYNGTVYSQNWDAAGQATFDNGCEAPDSSSSTSSTTSGSETTTTTGSETTTTTGSETTTTTSDTNTTTTEIPFFPSWTAIALGVGGILASGFVMARRRL